MSDEKSAQLDTPAPALGEVWKDDPKKDYRKRYRLPEHWLLDDDSPFAVDYKGYIRSVLSLFPRVEASPSAPRPKLLDAGCGDGFVSHKLMEMGYDVTGVDYSERAIGFARLFVDGARFQCADLRELKKQSEFERTFDWVLSVEVLEHLPVEYQLLVLENLVWALKDSGRLVLSVPSLHIRPSYTHYKHFSLEEIKELLGQAGLAPEQVIHQNRLSFLNSRTTWKLVRNKAYDLVFVRRFFRWLFLRRYNVGQPGEKVGRYILSCRKTLS
jgi:2-polyprenyl-3-methyl-5-hydroxy-6-metoxy-1,4-benzoquinol methylase